MSLLESYQQKLSSGGLSPDPAQLAAATALGALAARLSQPVASPRFALFRRIKKASAIKGLYLVGPVGRGKSMLMDLFFTHAAVPLKRRVHFNDFMLEVHTRLHALRKRADTQDHVLILAREILAQNKLLCFDEFQVTDIADAMILSRLFTALFEGGLVMVATSNTTPQNLYAGGLQRSLFLPFIDVLLAHCDVLSVDGGTDYRRLRLSSIETYHAPLGPEADAATDKAFLALSDEQPASALDLVLESRGRSLRVPKAAGGVAQFTFKELCDAPLSAADYTALALAFPALVVCHVPVMQDDARNPTQRFITLIDVLYEHKTKLVISAAAPADALCRTGQLAPAFERTASRLHEMQSSAWWERDAGGAP